MLIDNPFQTILDRINDLDTKLSNIPLSSTAPISEVINTQELCRRLSLTEPTVIKWRQKKKIPFFKVGSAVRYNWPTVLASLEIKKNK